MIVRRALLLGLMLLVGASTSAKADLAFSQNFDSGPGIDIMAQGYWADTTLQNGIIATSSGSAVPGRGNQIASDASGSGYFLYEGTAGDGNPTVTDALFRSGSFAVQSNTEYIVSFLLINQNTLNAAQIELQIGGQTFGPVSATGLGTSGTVAPFGWQTFSFAWNSGANTSADLILTDLETASTGNDFGIDNIQVASVPEPSTFSMAILGSLGMIGYSRLRRKSRS